MDQNILYYIITFLLGYIVSNHMNQLLIEGGGSAVGHGVVVSQKTLNNINEYLI